MGAPEIVMNLGHGKAVDWWSLGILLFELTVGIPPFYSQNVNEMYRKIQSAPLQFPPQITVSCRSLVSLLLERNPRRRLGSGYDDVEELKRHPFFKNINWTRLYQKKIKPTYRPAVQNELDTSNFDAQFTQQPINGSVAVSTHESAHSANATKQSGHLDVDES